MWRQIVEGAAASGAIAALALWRGALAPSGAAAALAIGTAIFVGGGPRAFGALGAFFVTSTLLGRVGRARKAATKREFSKGDRRDAWQALANGGVAAGAALLSCVAPPSLHAALLAAIYGALATANGDTWATELGVLSRGEPFSLVRARRVPRGTSGAVSPLGLAATVGGAALVALFALPSFGAVVAAGTIGSLVDSLLGATVQAGFHCDACARDCEAAVHHCGTPARHVRGLRAFGNDAVNLAATLAGALVAASLTS
jgi:uncharacterized protein (TIGR00297 family)